MFPQNNQCIPQNDLDCFYNSEWKKQNADHYNHKKSINNFSLVQDKIDNEMIDWINELESIGNHSVIDQLVDFRDSFYTKSDSALEAVWNWVHPISRVTQMSDLINIIQSLNQYKIFSLFTLHVMSIPTNPDIYTLYIGEPSLSLEDKYVYDDTSKLSLLHSVVTSVAKFISEKDSEQSRIIDETQFVNDVIVLEIMFAHYVFNLVEAQDPELIFSFLPINDFIKTYDRDTNQFWKPILNSVPNLQYVMFENPRYLQFLILLVCAAGSDSAYLRMLKNFVIYSIFKKYGIYMSIGKSLLKLTPFGYEYKKLFITTMQHYFGYYLEERFDAKYYDQKKTLNVHSLFLTIKGFCQNVLQQTVMLTEPTKKEALKKINNLDIIIGTQKYKSDLNKIPRLSMNNFYSNLMILDKYYFQNSLSLIGLPKNRSWLSINHDTYSFKVNAYYIPHYNLIYLPTSVLSDVFYKTNAEPIYNYGGLGAFIGHEMMHGFDNHGSKYNHLGQLENWWAPSDHTMFLTELEKVIEHYSTFDSEESSHQRSSSKSNRKSTNTKVDSRSTIGENLADIVGMKLSLRAYIQKHLLNPEILEPNVLENLRMLSNPWVRQHPEPQHNLTPRQYYTIIALHANHLKKFFYRWAEVFRAVSKSDYLDYMIKVDPHSPSTVRINAPLSHIDEYYVIFGVKPDHWNYLEQSKRCKFMD